MPYYNLFYYTLGAFAIGATLIAITPLLSRNKTKKRPWLKFIVYFLVVHGTIVSIIASAYVFVTIAGAIVLVGKHALLKAVKRKSMGIMFKLTSFAVYVILASGFMFFSKMPTRQILYVYLLVITFDGFSQVSGQLLGRRKIAPKISPNKTLEGFLGGMIFTAIAAVLMRSLVEMNDWHAILVSSGVCMVSLAGDLMASWYKRKVDIKDFGEILPMHGGILDRFDSYIAAGCFYFLASYLWGIQF